MTDASGLVVLAPIPFDARAAQLPLRGGPEVELSFGRQIVVEELRHLGPDLVAAGPDRRPDDRRERR